MTHEAKELEDQKQTGMLEHPEEKERRLTPEAEKVIRNYVFKCLTPTGIVLVVISFVVGFFIHSVAFQSASNQALLSTQSEIIKLIREVMAAKSEVDNAVKSAQSSSTEIGKTEEKAKKFAEKLSSLENKLASTVAFQSSDPQIKKIAEVLARDPRMTNVLNDSIEDRLKKTDREIEELKSAHRIDCQEVKISHLENFKRVFEFAFPVTRAWTEPIKIDEVHDLMVSEINGNSVTVVAERVRGLRGFERVQYRKKESHYNTDELTYHVWATSF